ncbi:M1 family aminopeptidase [Mucilaginibacter sp. L3T2-6]|uniref:M1 family aminopeptidase n=1 Tax=Mucilaginibacter sp. L3T2-6 TaxID=3062491 RepID=UPI002674DE4A|nr:M1 family aminopeptidase [Mucilaginibacter sp. L3T2-6]MDO3640512.1 M1 family aminopeptidase [Mucilaginibacter sp. L3T2-6]MDV6213149.1 M1 family aminopeptidase [Mucilaginibacter sp. L3T2-6]
MNFKKITPFILSALFVGLAADRLNAQTVQAESPAMKIYRETPPKINDLVHTKLDVRFDYKKRYLYGKEWVTLRPHFYPTDTLRLDAKGMDLKTIAIVKNGKNIPLKFRYDDSLTVAIQLDKVYHNNESYTIYIDYTAKPNELHVKGSAAINDAKGLYFINPDGTEKDKPIQIWTQGETTGSSCWFPTIDLSEQKTTDEISMTVLNKYVTLSNGKLVSQKVNSDGTRTDTWRQDLPHSPYLFMMAVGDFKIYKDKWQNKEVSYYLEPKYAPYAKQIFGMTPELIEFYSKTLGVDYPWAKYSQIVVRDYVSGAMENTSATLHGEYVQETPRELIDAYYDAGRSTIAHELFHQWFGDLVTAESWSNLTVNESFADFSEMLWAEHKYGQDEADSHSNDAMQQYLNSPDAKTKNLVRFHYNDKEDVFDVVTYQKGGRILNMLRNYLGKEAFYKGLGLYLKTNAYKEGEPQQLRLALEQVSGRDLNWFFNQWYYGAGHPELKISYKYDEATKTETVYLAQTQDGQTFKLPMAIDIYAGGKKNRYKVWMNDKTDTLSFQSNVKPDLVNVDADKVLLTKKTDDKTLDEFAFQYFNAPLFMDRLEAITFAGAHQADKAGQKVILAALKDKYYGLRIRAIRALNMSNDDVHNAALPILTSLAQTDENTLVRAAAIAKLGALKASGNLALFRQSLSSQSYAVQAAALNAIGLLEPAESLKIAKGFESDNRGALSQAILNTYALNGTDDQWDYVYKKFMDAPAQNKFPLVRSFAAFTGRVTKPENAQAGITALKDLGIKYKQFGVGPFMTGLLTTIKGQRTKMNDEASAKAADEAVKAINDAK